MCIRICWINIINSKRVYCCARGRMHHVVTFINNNTSFNYILSILWLNFIYFIRQTNFGLNPDRATLAPCTSFHFPSMYQVYHLKSGLKCTIDIHDTIDHSICIQLYVVEWRNSKGWSILVTYFTCHDTSNKNKYVKILESIHHSAGFSSSWHSTSLNIVRTVALTHCSFTISIYINKIFFYITSSGYPALY